MIDVISAKSGFCYKTGSASKGKDLEFLENS